MGKHTAELHWERAGAVFSDQRYSRAHTWRFDGGTVVPASSSPAVVPLPLSVEAAVDPEEAFVASLTSCHLLWFLSLAAKAGLMVDAYRDQAEGHLGLDREGRKAITKVVLRPEATFSGAKPSREALAELHHRAHEACFIANSVKSEISVEPVESPPGALR